MNNGIVQLAFINIEIVVSLMAVGWQRRFDPSMTVV